MGIMALIHDIWLKHCQGLPPITPAVSTARQKTELHLQPLRAQLGYIFFFQ